MDDALLNPCLELISSLLELWSRLPEIKGAYAVMLLDHKGAEFRVLQTGQVPELSEFELKSLLVKTSEVSRVGWKVDDDTLDYPIRHNDTFFGICLLFPGRSKGIDKSWAESVVGLSKQIHLASLPKEDGESSLHSLARNILEHEPEKDELKAQRLHWENSKTRVSVALNDKLVARLLVDDLPLF